MPEDEFRKYYASLSDEGLREIDRDDLIDAARSCYDEEILDRGLKLESVTPEMKTGGAENVTWALLDTVNAAEIPSVRVLLEGEGIASRLENENNISPGWMGVNPHAGLVLLVPEPSLERAREVLASQVSEEELTAEAEACQPPEDA